MVSKKNMKKIFVLSAGRSDYDRYYPIISELNKNKKIKLWLCLTRSHQEEIFGIWQEAMMHAGIDAGRIDAYASRLARANIGPEKFSTGLTKDFLNELGINESQDVSKLLRFH